MAGAAHLGRRGQGQVRAVPERVPADGHQGAAAGRERVRGRRSPPVGTDIRFGLAAVRNVGTDVVEAIVAARRAKGAFTSFADFLRKVPVTVCNKRVIESLIKAGAFDSLGPPRRKGLVLIHEQAVDAVIDVKRNEASTSSRCSTGTPRPGRMFEVPVPAGRVGEAPRARLRARDARPVRLRPPAARPRARARRRDRVLDRPAARLGRARRRARRGRPGQAGRTRGRPGGHAGRDPVRAAAQGHPAGRRLGVGHAGGPRGRDRGDVLPGHLPACARTCSPRTPSSWSGAAGPARTSRPG